MSVSPGTAPPTYIPHLLDNGGSVRPHHDSLVEQWGERDLVSECPDAEYHQVRMDTGEAGPASRCRRSTCLYCVRVSARRIHRAVDLARPRLMILLTALTGDWQTDRSTVNRLTYYLRHRDGISIALAWAVEPNPEDTGAHAHAWSWGAPLPRTTIERRCAQVGLGMPRIKRVSSAMNFAYILKNATHNGRSLAEHRRLNGREIIHARGFWRDPEAATLLTKVEALRLADPRHRTEWTPPSADRLTAMGTN